jgi:hypothetical protein
MSVLNIVSVFVCDECDVRFSVELDTAKHYKVDNPLDMAILELKQEDDGKHFCVNCWAVLNEEDDL